VADELKPAGKGVAKIMAGFSKKPSKEMESTRLCLAGTSMIMLATGTAHCVGMTFVSADPSPRVMVSNSLTAHARPVQARTWRLPRHTSLRSFGATAQVQGSQTSRWSVVSQGLSVCALGLAAQRGAARYARKQKRAQREAGFFWEAEPDQKVAVITGASSGLGLAAAKALAQDGKWLVIMACRDVVKAEKVAKEGKFPKGNYKVMHLDLAANSSVQNFVRTFRTLDRPLDALVCNAAVYFPNAHKTGVVVPGLFPGGGPRWSADDHELSFAANYLGHFLLCNLMLDDLKKSTASPPKCIILGTVTASVNDKELGGMIPPLADLGDLSGLESGMKAPITMIDGGEFDGAKAYKDSKVCDVMLMRELHRRYHGSTGIAFSSLYPGCIAETNLFREHYPVFQSLFPVFQRNVTRAYVSEEEAGRRLAAVVSDAEYDKSGVYYSWQGKSGTGGEGGLEAPVNTEKKADWFLNFGSFRTLGYDEIGGEAADNERCIKLWDLSQKLIADAA